MTVNFTGDNPEYVGDGVYASFDGYHVWLETSDGITVTNRVALEPSVFRALTRYAQKSWNKEKSHG